MVFLFCNLAWDQLTEKRNFLEEFGSNSEATFTNFEQLWEMSKNSSRNSFRKYLGSFLWLSPARKNILLLGCFFLGPEKFPCSKTGVPVFEQRDSSKRTSHILYKFEQINSKCHLRTCQRKLALVCKFAFNFGSLKNLYGYAITIWNMRYIWKTSIYVYLLSSRV